MSRGVFDISVHSIEELEVLFERAEEIASRPRPVGGADSIVLVLHGPEVEFFAISNYDRYRSIVDRAARLDAFDVVDVKICRTMMQQYDIGADEYGAAGPAIQAPVLKWQYGGCSSSWCETGS